MKIGFLAYSPFVLEKYWAQLKDRANCWWGVTQADTAEALRQRGITQVVHCPDELQFVPDRAGNKYVSADPGRAEREVAARVDPDCWITDQTNRLTHAPKSCLWVQTFHGLCYKKHTFHPLTREYDLLLLPGEYHRREFVRRLGFTGNDPGLQVVGWPRTDDLCRGDFDRAAVLRELDLDPARPTVLFAPTWGGYARDATRWGLDLFPRWRGQEAEVFARLCEAVRGEGANFLVKTHHLSVWSRDAELRAVAERSGARWLTPGMSNLQIDPNPYLWATDVLISDLSGVIMDFLALDRPVVYIDPDPALDAWRDCSIPPEYRAGAVARTPEELVVGVREGLRDPDRHREARRRVREAIFQALDGRAAARAAEAILALARERGVA